MHIDYLIRTSSYALTMSDKSAPTDGWVILLIRINCFHQCLVTARGNRYLIDRRMEGGFLECEFLFLIGQNNIPSNSHFCQKGIGLCYTAHGIPCAYETKIQRTYEGDHQCITSIVELRTQLMLLFVRNAASGCLRLTRMSLLFLLFHLHLQHHMTILLTRIPLLHHQIQF